MKFHRLLCFFFVAVIIICCSCSDNDDFDKKFLYLPETIISTDTSSVRITTKYVYDELNHLVAIYDSSNKSNGNVTERDSVYTRIAYNTDGQPSEMKIEEWIYDADEFKPSKLKVYTFAYEDSKVRIHYGLISDRDKSSYTVELNGGKQAVKCTNDQTSAFMAFEYDKNGNISRTTNENDSIFTYEYDDRRGIFREINAPQWFVNIMLEQKRGVLTVYMNENRCISNNVTAIFKTDNSTGNRTERSRMHLMYGGFGYPIYVENDNATTSYIRYIPARD